MFHWFGTITNTKGDSQSGWQVECVQLGDGETVVPIFSDESSTPILTVSGVANRAVTDANGNYDFFVASGTYSLRFYDEAGEFQRLQRYLPMYGDTTAETAANLLAAQAAESGAEGFKDDAEAAALAATAVGTIYADTTAGIAGTTSGDYFFVENAQGNLQLYLNDAGTAVAQDFLWPGLSDVAAATAAANAAADTYSETTVLNRLATQNYDLAAGNFADFFVNRQTGDDLNSGLVRTAPKEDLPAAISIAATDDNIALFRGQRYSAPGVLLNQDLSCFGQATGYAKLDGRASLEGATWTDEGSNVYKTTVLLDEAGFRNGTGSNTLNFGVWFNDQFGVWKVGGADIAANVAAVGAAPAGELAFALNLTGSTVEDARDDTASVGPYDLYVRMPDSSDPDGKEVLYTYRRALAKLEDRSFKGIEFIGAHSKDSFGVNGDYSFIQSFEDCKFTDFGEHSYVGGANLTRTVHIGQPRAGTAGFSQGAGGTGINFYTNVFNSTVDLTINGSQFFNCSKGVYVHGSGNQGYRSLIVTGDPVVITNTRTGFDSDPAGAGLLPMFAEGVTCDTTLTMTDVDVGFDCDGPWQFIGGGTITLKDTPYSNARSLVVMAGPEAFFTLKDFTIKSNAPNTLSFKTALCSRTVSAAFTEMPVLVLDNVQDISDNNNRFQWPRGASPANIENSGLVLINGTVLGDLADAAARINFPGSLYVGAGCTVGHGDRDGPTLDTALAAAGLVEDETLARQGAEGYFYLDPQSTIVDLSGAVVSAAGWK